MHSEDDRIDLAVTQIIDQKLVAKHFNYDYDVEYEKLIDYLAAQWELNTEEDVLDYMAANGIKFWSPLPGEQPEIYKNFILFLQLPTRHRTIKNVERILYSVHSNQDVTPDGVLLLPYQTRLFWAVRAHLYEESMLEELTFSLQESQKQRIAAMRNRSMTIATLSSDISIEMLTKAVAGIRALDPNELSPTQLTNMIGTASKVGTESAKMAEQALLLAELIETVQELEELDEEEKRFLDAEVVDDA